MRPSIVVVTGDPGGANALAPVVSRLRDEGRVDLHSLVYREARSVWTKRALPFEALPESREGFDPASALRERGAQLLLTGTSYNPVEWEKRFILAARSLGLPSIALVDAWVNYRLRFSDDHGRLAFVPDLVAVMDEAARAEAIAEGLDAHRLVVTGRFTPERRAQIRRDLGVPPDGRLVMFASQPIALLLGTDASNPLFPGYTERTVLGGLAKALESIARRHPAPLTLAVRPHVRENAAELRLPEARGVRAVLAAAVDSRELALAADLVTGMSSVVLMETALLGRPTVSLQPGLRLRDTLPSNRTGLTTPVYRAEDVEATIEAAMFGPGSARPNPTSFSGGGVGRLVQLVYRTLAAATGEARSPA
jgi:hypothetical protein